jgi:hypothetical protein
MTKRCNTLTEGFSKPRAAMTAIAMAMSSWTHRQIALTQQAERKQNLVLRRALDRIRRGEL